MEQNNNSNTGTHTHLTDEDLIQYVDHRYEWSENHPVRQKILKHIATCGECFTRFEEVFQLQQVVDRVTTEFEAGTLETPEMPGSLDSQTILKVVDERLGVNRKKSNAPQEHPSLFDTMRRTVGDAFISIVMSPVRLPMAFNMADADVENEFRLEGNADGIEVVVLQYKDQMQVRFHSDNSLTDGSLHYIEIFNAERTTARPLFIVPHLTGHGEMNIAVANICSLEDVRAIGSSVGGAAGSFDVSLLNLNYADLLRFSWNAARACDASADAAWLRWLDSVHESAHHNSVKLKLQDLRSEITSAVADHNDS